MSIEFAMGENYRILMDRDEFKEKQYWKISKQTKNDDGEWRFSKQTILIPQALGKDFAGALHAFADEMAEGSPEEE